MTQLQIKKADKAELAQLIEWETAAYKGRFDGNDYDYDVAPDAKGNYPRKFFSGAVEKIVERSLLLAMGTLQSKLEEGYKIFLSATCSPEITPTGAGILYVTKPESVQAVELAKLATEVEAKYEASIDAHNDKVFEQEAKALRAEEEEARRLQALEDAHKADADFEKRVQARLRGMRSGK